MKLLERMFIIFKNIINKIIAICILFFCVGLPIISIIAPKNSTELVSITYPVEEIATTEIQTEQIKMIIEFEDKIKSIETSCDKEPTWKPETTTQIIIIPQTNKTEIIYKQKKITTTEKQSTTKKSISTTKEITNIEFILDEPIIEPTTIKQVEKEITTKKNVVAATTTTTKEPTTQITTTTTEAPTTQTSNSKYSVAAQVWNYLRSCGYNKAVCAGILGNMMAEVGGQTLALQPYLRAGNYYGLCMWSLTYFPEVSGASVNGQLNFLIKTMPSQFKMFGNSYYKGFTLNAFLSIQDPGTAAKAFAICYERCSSRSYSIRVRNAYTAYNYFA